ncbi:hypothetical protein ACTXGQ_14055 [Marinobacter sp. 1Y8]
MKIKVARHGIILNTENYSACVAFYRDLFDLSVLFEKTQDGFSLTFFQYGAGYR